MNNDIIIAIGTLGILGLIFGVVLSIASKIFAVEVDPKVEAIRKVLPGANCGACGFPGCDGLATAIAEGRAENNACIVGGAEVAEKVSNITGGNSTGLEKQVAVVYCQGDCDLSKKRFIYRGIEDCRAEMILLGGSKACTFGCLGCGTCVEACKFDAINVIGGVAVVNKEKCVACGKCVEVCPKGLIEIAPYKMNYHVKCKNTEKGKDVKSVCDIGCIGCQLCVNNCPKQTILFENNLAKIDYTNCINCGLCSKKCPTHAIPLQEKEKMEKIAN